MDRPPRLLTTRELARALSISERTIQRYRNEGKLHPDVETPGGHARWDPEKVRAELRELARQAREKYRRGE